MLFFIVALEIFISCESGEEDNILNEDDNISETDDNISNEENDESDSLMHGYDTIYPKSYFPVYPGSYWKYETSDNKIVTDTTSSDYKLHYYFCPDVFDSDTCYVPFFNGKPIYGYNKIVADEYPLPFCARQWRFFSEKIGDYFMDDWCDQRYDYTCSYWKVLAKYPNYNANNTVYDSVFVLKSSGGFPIDDSYVLKFYAKDIGLIQKLWIGQDTTVLLNLIEYVINRP